MCAIPRQSLNGELKEDASFADKLKKLQAAEKKAALNAAMRAAKRAARRVARKVVHQVVDEAVKKAIEDAAEREAKELARKKSSVSASQAAKRRRCSRIKRLASIKCRRHQCKKHHSENCRKRQARLCKKRCSKSGEDAVHRPAKRIKVTHSAKCPKHGSSAAAPNVAGAGSAKPGTASNPGSARARPPVASRAGSAKPSTSMLVKTSAKVPKYKSTLSRVEKLSQPSTSGPPQQSTSGLPQQSTSGPPQSSISGPAPPEDWSVPSCFRITWDYTKDPVQVRVKLIWEQENNKQRLG